MKKKQATLLPPLTTPTRRPTHLSEYSTTVHIILLKFKFAYEGDTNLTFGLLQISLERRNSDYRSSETELIFVSIIKQMT